MSYEEYEPQPRGWSPLAVAALATLVLLLGLGGALFGIRAARNAAQVDTSPSASSSALLTGGPAPITTDPAASATPSASATPGVSSTPVGGDLIVLPDLTGLAFQDARAKVRELKLGWRLVFEGADLTDRTVRATEPAAAASVHRGDSVKIFVRGAAPNAVVPDVTAMSCAQAAGAIVDAGLYPEYLTGRDGVAVSQSPGPTDATVRWNDTVRVSCVKPG